MMNAPKSTQRASLPCRWLLVVVVALGCFGYSAFAENERIQWTKQWGTANIETGAAVAVDSSGNVFVAGGTEGALDGNPNAGAIDAFITKYDSAGIKQWTRQLGTAGNEYAYAVGTDGSGNAYIAGITEGSIDGNTTSGSLDFYVAKYNASGDKQWTRQWGTATQDWCSGIYVSASGDVYVVGDTGASLHGSVFSGARDIFVMKVNTAGVRQWTRQWGSAGTESGNSVLVDDAENVYAGGSTTGGFDGNVNAGGSDIFLTKLNAAGTRLWTRQWGSPVRDDWPELVLDAAGNIYLSGFTLGALDGVSAGNYDSFLAKVDASGAKQWARQWGTAGSDSGTGIGLDSAGNVYVSGSTAGNLDGNTLAGVRDAFLTKFNAAGDKQWTRQWGTAEYDAVNHSAMDSAGNIYVVGYTSGSFAGYINAGNYDIFLTKFYPNHAPSIAWTGEPGYTAAGVSPAVGVRSSTYTYRITYTDVDNDAAAAGYPKLHIRKSGVAIAGSPFSMSYISGSNDTGAVYCASTTLQPGNDYTYYFEANDIMNTAAAGAPTGAASGPTVNITQPLLAWTGEEHYAGDGVYPKTISGGTYRYRVLYRHDENDGPQAGYPRVHITSNGLDIAGSPFAMSPADSNDYSAGRIYEYAATGLGGEYGYYFEARDIYGDIAIGAPTAPKVGPTAAANPPGTGECKVFHGVFKPGNGEKCRVTFNAPQAGEFTVRVYDGTGRQVEELFRGSVNPGVTSVTWDGKWDGGIAATSGVYIVQISGPGINQRKNVAVIR